MDELPRITAEIDAYVDQGSRYVSILRQVFDSFRKRKAKASERAEARRILGIATEAGVAYRHTSTHSDFTPHDPHPDNLDALESASRLEILNARKYGLLRIEDRSRAIDVEKNMVLLGSPTAEGLSRLIFGYEPAPGFADGLRSSARVPLDLPFRWQLDPDEIDPGALATRMVRGRGPVARPNWRIIRVGAKEPYIPNIDNRGWLASDYLLVTKLRNFITRNAYERGSYVVSFGGAHGTATRAIELLLGDDQTLAEVATALGEDPAAYQLLFKVDDMTHNANEGTRAHRIKLIRAELLEDNEERWRTASLNALPGLRTWLGHDGSDDVEA